MNAGICSLRMPSMPRLLHAHRALDGGVLAQQGEIAVLIVSRPSGDACENGRGRPKARFFRIPCQQQQKLTPAVGMMSFPTPDPWVSSPSLDACSWPPPCLLHSPPSLPKPERSKRQQKLNKNRARPGFFYGAELLAMDLFSRRRDLELQIRCAWRPLTAVDP